MIFWTLFYYWDHCAQTQSRSMQLKKTSNAASEVDEILFNSGTATPATYALEALPSIKKSLVLAEVKLNKQDNLLKMHVNYFALDCFDI